MMVVYVDPMLVRRKRCGRRKRWWRASEIDYSRAHCRDVTGLLAELSVRINLMEHELERDQDLLPDVSTRQAPMDRSGSRLGYVWKWTDEEQDRRRRQKREDSETKMRWIRCGSRSNKEGQEAKVGPDMSIKRKEGIGLGLSLVHEA